MEQTSGLPETGSEGPFTPPDGETVVVGRRRWVGLVAAVLAISIGSVVGIILAVSNRKSAPVATLKPGWVRFGFATKGFGIDLPPGWKAVPATSADEQYKALKDANPKLAALVRDQGNSGASSLIALLAYDVNSPTLVRDFATNVTIAVVPLPNGTDLDTFVNDNVKQLRSVPEVAASIETQRLELPAGPAALITSHFTSNAPGGSQISANTQYLLLRGSRGYIVSFSTLPSSLGGYAPLFNEIAREFRFV